MGRCVHERSHSAPRSLLYKAYCAGGGKLIASVKDGDGNVIGLIQEAVK